jgi:Holliday junction resolvase-like predicted endonuclease
METIKSSRHQKIIGEFGEQLICNWLSRSGFEVTIVDHTGIDIIAYYRRTQERLGITVKSRTRTPGAEAVSVTVFRSGKSDREKLRAACEFFACEPWIAIYVETTESGDLYLTSLENYDRKYRGKGTAVGDWKMKEKDKCSYEKDPEVKHIGIDFRGTNWFECPLCAEAEGSPP